MLLRISNDQLIRISKIFISLWISLTYIPSISPVATSSFDLLIWAFFSCTCFMETLLLKHPNPLHFLQKHGIESIIMHPPNISTPLPNIHTHIHRPPFTCDFEGESWVLFGWNRGPLRQLCRMHLLQASQLIIFVMAPPLLLLCQLLRILLGCP